MLLVHRERAICVVHRENFLPREIARPMIESEEITEEETPLTSAGGAKLRSGNRKLLTSVHGRNLIVEREIILGNLEGRLAVGTNIFHKHQRGILPAD